MTYIKFEHAQVTDERWLGAGGDAVAIHLAALDFCDQHLTDGRISVAMAPRVSLAVSPEAGLSAIKVLVKRGLWTKDGRKYYRIPDYFNYGFPAEQVRRTQARWKDDKDRRRQHKVGDHSLCKDPKYCPAIASAHAAGDHSMCVSRYCDAGRKKPEISSTAHTSTVEAWVEPHTHTRQDRTEPDPTGGRGRRSEERSTWAVGSADDSPDGSSSAPAADKALSLLDPASYASSRGPLLKPPPKWEYDDFLDSDEAEQDAHDMRMDEAFHKWCSQVGRSDDDDAFNAWQVSPDFEQFWNMEKPRLWARYTARVQQAPS